jgi:hypothetical protein
MEAGPFMVMNSDARHPKEFLTENTLGGNVVLPAADDNRYLNRMDVPSIRRYSRQNTAFKPFDSELLLSTGERFSSLHRALMSLFTPSISSSSTEDEPSSCGSRTP